MPWLSIRQQTTLGKLAVFGFCLAFWTGVISCISASHAHYKEVQASRARERLVEAQTIERVCTDLQDYGLELSIDDCVRLFNEI